MVSFTAAVTALLAVVSTTNGFTSYTSNKRSATILQSTTESFQRSLLEAQIANSASTTIPAEHVVVVTSVNGSSEQQRTTSNHNIATQQTQINAILRISA